MTGDIDRLLHHGPDWWSAVGTVFNAIIVFILALINVLYLLAARRQAKAAERQTEEIKDQIALSREQLNVMRNALRLSVTQDNVARRNRITMAISELRKIEAELTRLLDRASKLSPSFTKISEDIIVPSGWNLIARCIEQELDRGDVLEQWLHRSLLATKEQLHDLINERRRVMSPETDKELRNVFRNRVESTLEKVNKVTESLEQVLSSLRLGLVGTDHISDDTKGSRIS